MDWQSIILIVVGAVSSVDFYNTVRYRRQLKREKNASAVASEVDSQKKQIDLGQMYLEKVVQLTEGGMSNISEKINMVEGKIDTLNIEVKSIVQYLNGGYKKYLEDKK